MLRDVKMPCTGVVTGVKAEICAIGERGRRLCSAAERTWSSHWRPRHSLGTEQFRVDGSLLGLPAARRSSLKPLDDGATPEFRLACMHVKSDVTLTFVARGKPDLVSATGIVPSLHLDDLGTGEGLTVRRVGITDGAVHEILADEPLTRSHIAEIPVHFRHHGWKSGEANVLTTETSSPTSRAHSRTRYRSVSPLRKVDLSAALRFARPVSATSSQVMGLSRSTAAGFDDCTESDEFCR